MLIIIARFEFSEASRSRVLAIVRNMDAETAKEAGCLFYKHAIDIDNSNRIILSEIWTDAARLLAHFHSLHFRTFRAAVAELGIRSTLDQFNGIETKADAPENWRSLLRKSLANE